MSEHVMLNEETGELVVSDEVSTLLDGMVEVLESAGYDIEDGMEAEEFVEQVGEVLESDEELDEAKKKALKKSHKAVAAMIKAAHAEDDDADAEEDDAEEACDDDDSDDDDDAGDDDGDDDAGDDDEKADKKPFFLKKKAKADDADEAVEGDETEGDEQEESTITQHTMKHAAQKGYSPGWSAHKAGHPGAPAKNKHGAYTIHSVRPNKGPKKTHLHKSK